MKTNDKQQESVDSEDQSGVISIDVGVSRRKLMKQLSAVGLAGGMAGCTSLRSGGEETDTAETDVSDTGNGSGGGPAGLPNTKRVRLSPPPTADELDFSNPADPERHVSVVLHVVDEFMSNLIPGINDALNQIGWTGEVIGPSTYDPAEQIEMLNTTIDSLDGGGDSVLVTVVTDGDQYEDVIMRAVEKEIPVLHTNTTVEEWDEEYMMENFGYVQPYIGQDMEGGGVAVGQEAYKRAMGRLDDDELVLLTTIGAPGHPALEARARGGKKVFEAHDNTTVLETLDVSDDIAEATSRITDKYRSNPDINVIIGTGPWGAIGASRVVENEGLAEDVVTGGFELNEGTLQAIEEGYRDFGSTQDGYSQGYVPVMMASMYMDRGIPMKDFDTGAAIVDEDNIEWAKKAIGNYDALTQWQEENYDL